MTFSSYLKFFRSQILFSFLFTLLNLSLILFCFWKPIFLPLSIFILGVSYIKIYEWVDDRFIDTKIGQWMSKQKIIYVKFDLNSNYSSNVSEIEKLLLSLHAAYGSRSQKNMRVEGKYFEDFSFEIHTLSGQIEMFLKMYNNSKSLFETAMKLHLPNLRYSFVEDPLTNFPPNWSQAQKHWKVFDGGEFALANAEIFPIKLHNELTFSNSDYQTTPINQLINILQGVTDGDYICLQFLIRPQDTNEKKSSWGNSLNKLKKEYASNSSIGVSASGNVNPYTPQELSIINKSEQKINSPCFQTKIRFTLLGKKTTSKKYLAGIMSYWKNFATEKQAIIPKPKSWDESPNATWGIFWDNLYWTPEIEKRARQFYLAFINRSFGRGGETQFWDINSLASILQIPNLSNPNNTKSYSETENVTKKPLTFQERREILRKKSIEIANKTKEL